MPIIYVHGVAVRDINAGEKLVPFLRHYVAPVLNSDQPDKVEILPVYWGRDGVQFAWQKASRPRTALLGQGGLNDISTAERSILLASLGNTLGTLPSVPTNTQSDDDGLQAFGPKATTDSIVPTQRLFSLSENELSNLLAALLSQQLVGKSELPQMLIAADVVAHEPDTVAMLKKQPTVEAEVSWLQNQVKEQFVLQTQLVAFGVLTDFKDRLLEIWARTQQAPGFVVSRLLGELRPKLNDGVTLFLGDVFEYLAHRLANPQEASDPTLLEDLIESHAQQPKTNTPGYIDDLHPGPIPNELLVALKKAHDIRKAEGRDEPIVVITHSMGGQIMYDTVTAFLPKLNAYKDIRVDFWCAVASQVGLFEEMKLFLISDPQYSKANGNKVPFPDRRYLGVWWNVWDLNDVLSFTAEPIFEDVNDEYYDSGSSTINAHGGYFLRPSFYRKLADKLRQAEAKNWNRPV